MDLNRIGPVNTGANINGKPGKIKDGKSPGNISDSFSKSGNNDNELELDLEKISRTLLKKTGEGNWPTEPTWTFTGVPSNRQAPVLGQDKKIYVLDGKGISVLEPSTGEKKNEFRAPGKITGFAINHSGQVAACDEKSIYGFDSQSGEIKWKLDIEKLSDIKGPLNMDLTAGPDNTLYAADRKRGLFSIDIDTGDIKWQKEELGQLTAKPALTPDGKYLYCAIHEKGKYIIDTDNGKIITKNSYPKYVGNIVYTAMPDGRFLYGFDDFYSVQLHDGKPNTTETLYSRLGGLTCKPILDAERNTMYLPDKSDKKGKLLAIDPESAQVKFETLLSKDTGHITAMAIAPDGTIFTGHKGDTVYAFDNKNGKQKWKFKIEGEKSLSPTTDQKGNLIIKGNSGKIYTYSLNLTDSLKKEEKTESSPTIKQEPTFVEIGGVKLPVNKPLI